MLTEKRTTVFAAVYEVGIGREKHGGMKYGYSQEMETYNIDFSSFAAVCQYTVRVWGWLAGICILLILLTGFSRNYLGVHTP